MKHGKVRWRVALAGTRQAVPGMAGYTAGIDQAAETELLDAGEATLDASGSLGIDVPLSGELADGRRSLAVTATVLDFDSRAATRRGRVVDDAEVPGGHLGRARSDPRPRAGEPERGGGGPRDGKPVQAGELTVAVLRRAHTHISKRNEEGDFYDAAQPVMIRAFEWKTKLAAGIAPIHMEPSGAGSYALEVAYRAPDGTTYRSSRAFRMRWDYDYEGED